MLCLVTCVLHVSQRGRSPSTRDGIILSRGLVNLGFEGGGGCAKTVVKVCDAFML